MEVQKNKIEVVNQLTGTLELLFSSSQKPLQNTKFDIIRVAKEKGLSTEEIKGLSKDQDWLITVDFYFKQ